MVKGSCEKKEGVSTLFPLMLLRNLVSVRIRIVVGNLGTTFTVTPVVFRSVLAVSLGMLVVTDVSVSSPPVGVLGEVFSFEIVKPQTFLSPENVKPSMRRFRL